MEIVSHTSLCILKGKKKSQQPPAKIQHPRILRFRVSLPLLQIFITVCPSLWFSALVNLLKVQLAESNLPLCSLTEENNVHSRALMSVQTHSWRGQWTVLWSALGMGILSYLHIPVSLLRKTIVPNRHTHTHRLPHTHNKNRDKTNPFCAAQTLQITSWPWCPSKSHVPISCS